MVSIKDTAIILSLALLGALTVVYAAPTAGSAGVKTLDTDTTKIGTCQQGFKAPAALPTAADACTACGAGSYTSDGNTVTACVSCEAGYYCPAPNPTTGVTTGAAQTSCTAAGTYCAAGVATATSCAVGNYCPDTATQTTCPAGHYCTVGLTAALLCAENTLQPGTGKTEAASCTAYGGTAITGCRVYAASTAGAETCQVAKDGYFLEATPGTAAQTKPCVQNCAKCTGSTNLASCTETAAGYFKGTTAIEACITGCKTCTGTTASLCTVANDGYYLAAGAITACGSGTGAAAGATAASFCTTCGSTCATCTATTFCKTCQPGYTITASTGVCTLFSGTPHVTCQLAEGTTDGDCNTCDETQNRMIEKDTTVTPAIDKQKGKCLCKEGFAEEATVVAACKACGNNVATCTFNSAGVETITACKATFTKLTIAGVTACVAANLSGTDVIGFFWDTTATTSQYVACNVGCKTCTGAGADKCVLCPARPSSWVAPTESEANYATYLTLITNINNTCYADCPTGWEASETKDSCVAAGSGSASGIFGIILLIASLFLLI